ncbi:MAG: hypothetical protein CSA13_00060 [Clostridiales bacterium]|nr:MAG: hypothetical protein CSA13_00060 [Clostridiales bacterium]
MQKKCRQALPFAKQKTDFLSDMSEVQLAEPSGKLNMLILVTDDAIGAKANHHGARLLRQIINGLASKKPLPNAMIFLNRAVYLTSENSALLSTLRQLEAEGVAVLSNCSCLEQYDLMEKLAVGGLTNSYHVAELIKLAKNTVTL